MTSPMLSEEADKNVGRTSPMVQGWRPYSATNQPSSAAIHGAGIDHSAARSSHLRLSATRLAQ